MYCWSLNPNQKTQNINEDEDQDQESNGASTTRSETQSNFEDKSQTWGFLSSEGCCSDEEDTFSGSSAISPRITL